MIPKSFIIEWRQHAPWISDEQVEQDLIISRALVELFSSELIAKKLAFRGGTALYKLYSKPSPRYSEDIDLVQVDAAPIGKIITEIRKILDPWLGQPKRKQGSGPFTLVYSFQSEGTPSIPMKLKVEINTREHFSVKGFIKKEFKTNSRWFQGNAQILTYHLEELMGTKLRALYQRRKGRDLFDLWFVMKHNDIDVSNVVKIFNYYLDKQGLKISRIDLEKNLMEKATSQSFVEDIRSLLSPEIEPQWSLEEGLALVRNRILPYLSDSGARSLPLNNIPPSLEEQNSLQYVYLALGLSRLHKNRLVNLSRNEVDELNNSEDHLCEPLKFNEVSKKWEARYEHDKIYEVVVFYVHGDSGKEFVSYNSHDHNRTHTKLDRAQLGDIFQVPGYFLNDWNNRIDRSGTLYYWFQPLIGLTPKMRKRVLEVAKRKHPHNTFD